MQRVKIPSRNDELYLRKFTWLQENEHITLRCIQLLSLVYSLVE